MSNIEDTLKQTALQAAKETGNFLMENIDKIKADEISYDANSAPTTKIDKEAEQKIIDIIKASFPNHAFLGEELGEITAKSEYKWIIDPIDGTNNYIAKRDTFSVSIGLEYKGEIILGVVYLPKRDELFLAERGKGATLNNQPIHLKNTDDLSKANITYSTYPGKEAETKKLDQKILAAIPQVEYFGADKPNPVFGRGSMAAEFCYLACGRLDGLIRLKQKPWDAAAGSLIAAEAGAKMVNLEGGKCSIYEGDYIAGNDKIVDQILKIIK